MKNKTKKILAGACLGLVGMGLMTGCSMNEDQKAALDLIVNKADEVIELVENQNKQLSKQGAYDMIVMANNALKMGLINEFEVSYLSKVYNNYFEEEIIPTNTSDDCFGQRLKYSMKENIKKFECEYFGYNGGVLGEIACYADYNNEKYYYGDSSENNGDFKSITREETFDFSVGGYMLSAFIPKITAPDEIFNISVSEDGSYLFTWFSNEDRYTERYDIVLKDNLIRSFELWQIYDSGRDDMEIESSYTQVNFSYENIDFSALDAKIAGIQA